MGVFNVLGKIAEIVFVPKRYSDPGYTQPDGTLPIVRSSETIVKTMPPKGNPDMTDKFK